jgi:predicted ATP-grasp superfamily ATP-dependent carboligase
MELVERATGVSMFGVHQAACQGRLPEPAAMEAALCPRPGARFQGKAIVYAPRSVMVTASEHWLARGVRDVPHPGEVIQTGRPICTVLATGASPEACLAALRAEEALILEACPPSRPDDDRVASPVPG